jgi:hypothetical protein
MYISTMFIIGDRRDAKGRGSEGEENFHLKECSGKSPERLFGVSYN